MDRKMVSRDPMQYYMQCQPATTTLLKLGVALDHEQAVGVSPVDIALNTQPYHPLDSPEFCSQLYA
jgi:hypothetical protein